MSKKNPVANVSIADRLAAIHSVINTAATKSGRSSAEIELVAVSKTQAPEAVQEAMDAGHLLFGESRVQEARAKIPLLPGRAQWHFLGHLQKNKIRHALPLFELFHGIDSVELARDLDRIAEETGASPRILLEINVAAEASKYGFRPDTLRRQMESLLGFRRLSIEGLMCIPPLAPEAEHSRSYFAALRELRDEIQNEFRVQLPQLSMGMSGDYGVAVEEGATLIRVGSAIFGERRGGGWKPAPSAVDID
jgi:PLP dependent protein